MPENKEVVLFPDFGDSDVFGKVWVIETPVKPGDFVIAGDTLLTVESDKATLEVPSPKAGRITSILVNIGDVVTKQTPMLEMEPLNVSRQDFREEDERLAPGMGNSVFLVHGHNGGLREMGARFMEKLGLQVIILDEQVSCGSPTIIEKLERHSLVQFAVVLMTADDIGGKKGDTPESLQARARQNVVLELGYFMGKIGRHKVCVLYEKGVELPSDYYGVVFIEIDEKGAWRYALAKELRQGGLAVDLNRL